MKHFLPHRARLDFGFFGASPAPFSRPEADGPGGTRWPERTGAGKALPGHGRKSRRPGDGRAAFEEPGRGPDRRVKRGTQGLLSSCGKGHHTVMPSDGRKPVLTRMPRNFFGRRGHGRWSRGCRPWRMAGFQPAGRGGVWRLAAVCDERGRRRPERSCPTCVNPDLTEGGPGCLSPQDGLLRSERELEGFPERPV
jgi:hypothetical protein